MSKLNALRESNASAGEWVSALFDGELDPEASKRAVAGLGKDAEMERLWQEYSLIGDVLRGHPAAGGDLRSRISAALADEPTVLAPLPNKSDMYRPLYLAAAAAAVAAIAWGVLSVSPQGGEPAVPVAVNSAPAGVTLAANDDVQPYLAAHQDYAYAVADEPEMRFTQVSMAGGSR